ncbi:hypothetical protein GCM10010988_28930 [Cnuibacter physcomitrellae]|nr:hypothetical protein GCM10010988_28930 [Cnuibacter physcomitrellae]
MVSADPGVDGEDPRRSGAAAELRRPIDGAQIEVVVIAHRGFSVLRGKGKATVPGGGMERWPSVSVMKLRVGTPGRVMAVSDARIRELPVAVVGLELHP